MKRERFILINIFGVLLILSSLDNMIALSVKKEWYWNYYSYLPAGVIPVRYLFSWFQRVLGMACGMGLLLRNDLFRKTAVLLGAFTILVGYWKHPPEAFISHVQQLYSMGFPFRTIHPGNVQQDIQALARAGAIVSWVLDIIFWGCFIYYFTRPKIKAQFRVNTSL